MVERCSLCDRSSNRFVMVDASGYLSSQPVFHDWRNKGRGMCYSIWGMVPINDHLLLFGKSRLAHVMAAVGFSLSLFE